MLVVFSPSRPCRFPFPNYSFKTHKTTLGSQIKRDDDDDGDCIGISNPKAMILTWRMTIGLLSEIALAYRIQKP
ncbi:unnamed protein product [Sphagnum balticum]